MKTLKNQIKMEEYYANYYANYYDEN